MATFRKRGPYQWQAQVRKKAVLIHPWTTRHSDILSSRLFPPQCNTFDTRAAAEKWVRAVEYEILRIPSRSGIYHAAGAVGAL